MKSIFAKIKSKSWVLRSIIPTIYFNFHYLPFKQAVRLPIFLYKPHLKLMKGTVSILGGVKTGMIELGKNQVCLYPYTGFIFNNEGGEIIFHGRCSIGNNSAIAIGKKAKVEFGNNFKATTTFKLASQYRVVFKDDVLFGWDCLVMDTDFHKLTKDSGGYTKGYGSVTIGESTWFGNGVLVLKGTRIPEKCVVGAKSVLSGEMNVPNHSLISGNPAVLRKTGIWLNRNDDKVSYLS